MFNKAGVPVFKINGQLKWVLKIKKSSYRYNIIRPKPRHGQIC